MKLPDDIKKELLDIRWNGYANSETRDSCYEALVRDCAKFVAELHMNMPTTDYQTGVNEGYRIASYSLLQRYGIEP